MSYLLSLDLSTKSTGLAILDENKEVITSTCIKTNSTDVIKRIKFITEEIRKYVKEYPITRTVMEEVRPDGTSSFSTRNRHTEKMLLWLQASVVFMLDDEGIKECKVSYEYPSQWRSKCGIKTGRGVKRDALKQVAIDLVKEKFGLIVNDDEAEAICLGLGYLNN